MLGERRPNFLFSDLELSLLRLKFAFNSVIVFEADNHFYLDWYIFCLLELQWLSDQLWIRDVNCCNSHPIKCWRHYLNDLKTENFLLVNDQIFLDVDNLMDGWTTRTRGVSEFHLDWCVPVLDGKSWAHYITWDS